MFAIRETPFRGLHTLASVGIRFRTLTQLGKVDDVVASRMYRQQVNERSSLLRRRCYSISAEKDERCHAGILLGLPADQNIEYAKSILREDSKRLKAYYEQQELYLKNAMQFESNGDLEQAASCYAQVVDNSRALLDDINALKKTVSLYKLIGDADRVQYYGTLLDKVYANLLESAFCRSNIAEEAGDIAMAIKELKSFGDEYGLSSKLVVEISRLVGLVRKRYAELAKEVQGVDEILSIFNPTQEFVSIARSVDRARGDTLYRLSRSYESNLNEKK